MDTNNELHEGEYAEDAKRVAKSYSEPLQGQFVLDLANRYGIYASVAQRIMAEMFEILYTNEDYPFRQAFADRVKEIKAGSKRKQKLIDEANEARATADRFRKESI